MLSIPLSFILIIRLMWSLLICPLNDFLCSNIITNVWSYSYLSLSPFHMLHPDLLGKNILRNSLRRLKRLYSPGNFSSLSEWFLFGAIRRSPWHPFPADFRNIHDPGRELWARGCFCRVSHSRGLPTVSWSPFSVWKKYWKKDFFRNIDKSSSYIANFSSVTKIGLLYYKRITFCYKI